MRVPPRASRLWRSLADEGWCGGEVVPGLSKPRFCFCWPVGPRMEGKPRFFSLLFFVSGWGGLLPDWLDPRRWTLLLLRLSAPAADAVSAARTSQTDLLEVVLVVCLVLRACVWPGPTHQCLCPFPPTLCALARALTILAVTTLFFFWPPAGSASRPYAGRTPIHMSAILFQPDFPSASAFGRGTRVRGVFMKAPACAVVLGSLAVPA